MKRCNLHPACDEGEDELNCEEEYKRKRLIPKEAIYPCQSPHYNEASVAANKSNAIVRIHAVPCDGKEECWGEADEKWCKTEWLSYFLLGNKNRYLIPGCKF